MTREVKGTRVRAGILLLTMASLAATACAGGGDRKDGTDTSGAMASVAGQSADKAPEKMAEPDAEMQAVLDEHAALGAKPLETLTPQEARKGPSPADAVKSLLQKQGKPTAPEPVGKVVNRTIPGPAGQIKVRIYTPRGTGPFPVIVYYHGGGWVIADLDTYDASARGLTNGANAIVVSSHYRQGPENKFPAAHDDAWAAYEWTVKNAASFGGDTARLAIAGESAGGNLAAFVSMTARDKKWKMPSHQLLVYPIASSDMNSPSYIENGNAKPLSKAGMEWFAKHALNTPEDANDWRVSLLKGDMKGLPPTTIVLAQIDPLRSDGRALGEKLKDADVDTEIKQWDNVAHEFFGMGAVHPKAKDAMAYASGRLKSALQR